MPARLTSTSIAPNALRASATAASAASSLPTSTVMPSTCAAGTGGTDLRERGIHRVDVAVDQRDARALLAEQQPGRGADPPCPAGDDRNLVGKPTRHVLLPRFLCCDSVRMHAATRQSRHPRTTMDIIDLSMPIGPHFRWSPELRIKGDIAAGDQFRVSHLATTCHGFTHVDAQAHFVAHAPTIEATPLSRVVGPARVIDLRDVAPNTAIDARAAREPRSGRRGGRDPDPVRRLGYEARQHHARRSGRRRPGSPATPPNGCSRASRPRSRSTFRRTIRSGCCSTA